MAGTRKQSRKNNKRKATRKLVGGKYVARGTYGCGFSPALRCEDETERKLGLFSKLMETSDALKEQSMRDILYPVDPTMKYILYPVKVCKVNKSLITANNPENNVGSCPLDNYPDNLDNALAVQYIDGGQDLEKVKIQPYKFLPIFKSLTNLFLGVYKLHRAGLSHNDIKIANIVTKEKGDGSFTTRLVDIGFVHRMANGVLMSGLPFDSDYYVWPYEMRFSVAPVMKSSIRSVRDWHKSYDYSKFDYIPFEFLHNDDGSKKFTLEKAEALESYYMKKAEALCPKEATKDEIYKKVSELVLKTVDTYSLGFSLLSIYNDFLRHRLTKRQIEFLCMTKQKPYGWRSVDLLEAEGIPEETQQWHQTVASEISKPYIQLCLDMMDLDPAERDALPLYLVRYQKILKKMEIYFTEDQIERHIK